jgi:hypothetical protein
MQKGFSVLHVLPMVAIVVVVSAIGVKVMNKSGATNQTLLTCSGSFSGVNITSKMVAFSVRYSLSSASLKSRSYEIRVQSGQNSLWGGSNHSYAIVAKTGTTWLRPGEAKGWSGAAGPFNPTARYTLTAYAYDLTSKTVTTCIPGRYYAY